jgi:hypothetical protein
MHAARGGRICPRVRHARTLHLPRVALCLRGSAWAPTYDGKDYPITGSPDFDALSARRVDPNTVESTQKRMGKAVGTTTRTVSKDGKTLTLVSKLTNAKGEVVNTTLVYDRQ